MFNPLMPKADPAAPVRRERFRDYCRAKGWEMAGGRWNTSAVATAIDKPTNKASDLLNGQGSFGSKIAREIEETLGLQPGYFDAIGESDEFTKVMRVDVSVSAGHGVVVFYEGEKSALSFRRDFLRSCDVAEKNAVIVDVKGDSMSPTIADGSVLLLNRGAKTIVNGLVYAFRLEGQLFVKRLYKEGDGLVARSDNPAHPEFHIGARDESFEMIGRAVWMGAKL